MKQLTMIPRRFPLFAMACCISAMMPFAGTARNAAQPIAPSARLVCALQAPDTIRFAGDRYAPDIFSVRFRVENTGDADAVNVKAFVLQDNNFTMVTGSKPEWELPVIYPQSFIDFAETDGFLLRVVPRAESGLDTIAVVVVADSIPPVVCKYVVYVEGEKRPALQIACILDSRLPMYYDPALQDYVPNPFTVTTVITNTGTAPAHDCEIVLIAPRSIEPYGQNSKIPITAPNGAIGPGESYSFTWNLLALRQPYKLTDTLVFRVQCRCCINNDAIYSECRLPMTFPEVRLPAYKMVCHSPGTLIYDAATNSYIPDPFIFSVDVTNTGNAEGRGIKVTPIFPARVYLSSGETAEKTIPTLPVGSTVRLTWALSPVAEPYDEKIDIFASLIDTLGIKASCQSETFIPAAFSPSLALSCQPEFGALTIDTLRGDYLPENPFEVYLTITNTSQNPIFDVQAELTTQSRDAIIISSPNRRDVAAVMGPGQSITSMVWTVRVKPRTVSGDLTFCFRVTSSNAPPVTCCATIFVPAMGRPALDCTLSRNISGTDDYVLDFIPGTGDYEGEQGINHTYFTLTANVMNIGQAKADQVRVRIAALDGGAVLMEGESPVKELATGPDLIVNGQSHASWKFRPVCHPSDLLHRFELTVTSNNAPPATCVYEMTIQGAPMVLDISLPGDLTGRHGDTLMAPVTISPTIGVGLTGYTLLVQYDPTLLQYVDAITEGTLTGKSWNGPQSKLFTSPGSSAPDVVRITDGTLLAPRSTEDAVLVYLRFGVTFGGKRAAWLTYITTPLTILPEFESDGIVYRSHIDNQFYGYDCLASLRLQDGKLTLGGECIVPLIAGEGFAIAQNRPNPFNPATVIDYAAGKDAHITIEVYDLLGRRVRTLVDEFKREGRYQAIFNAAGMPSGLYYCRMTAPGYSRMIQMVLAR